MNIFEEIRDDHEKQLMLFRLLLTTNREDDDRRILFGRLKDTLLIHANAEEKYFYIPLYKIQMTHDIAHHSVARLNDIEDLLLKLDELDFSSPGWMPMARQLREIVTAHFEEQEDAVFDLAEKALSEEQIESMALKYRAAIDEEE